MHSALVAFLTDTVMVAPYTGQDGYGAPTHGTPVATPCRVESRTQVFTNAHGQERVSRALIFFDGTVTLDIRYKLTLEDGTSPAIERVDLWKTPQGTPDHWEVII
jgi:hypothetical protein